MSAARGTPRGIPTSRTYWELQAEKLLNRVFEPAETIDLDPLQGGEAGEAELGAAAGAAGPGSPTSGLPALEAPVFESPALEFPVVEPPVTGTSARPRSLGTPTGRQRRARRAGHTARAGSTRPEAAATAAGSGPEAATSRRSLPQPLLLVAVFAGAGLITASSGVLALSQWNRFQESLQQERNLLLVERLRSFGPAAQPAPAPAAATPPAPTLAPPAQNPAVASGGQGDDAVLPPPPPAEPWIQELATLPQPQRSAPLLRVPVSPALRAASAPQPRPRTPAGPVPLLVGVVAVPGKPGSAIFQMGGSTSTVSVGDNIGGSGWRLIASDGDGVQIEHQGEVRRISIGGGS